MKRMKIFLVDDHKIFREGLKNLLEFEEVGTIVGEACNGEEFLENVETAQPDLVLMDISMPILNGIETTHKAIERFPDMKIIALSMHGDEEYYYQMIEAGVKGFLLKDSGIKEIERALYMVYEGESYFSNELLRRIITNISKPKTGLKDAEEINSLTKREIEVLREVCNGSTNDEIAEKLFISTQTVKGHRSNILSKTNCRNSASLVMYAIKNKLVNL